ncbi:MAG TPA: hypothetical protein V6D27_16545 [Vampirovibrionales bacterium]
MARITREENIRRSLFLLPDHDPFYSTFLPGQMGKLLLLLLPVLISGDRSSFFNSRVSPLKTLSPGDSTP